MKATVARVINTTTTVTEAVTAASAKIILFVYVVLHMIFMNLLPLLWLSLPLFFPVFSSVFPDKPMYKVYKMYLSYMANYACKYIKTHNCESTSVSAQNRHLIAF